MKKLVFTCSFFLISVLSFGQGPDTELVKSAINNFFTAMNNSDSTGLKNSLAANAIFQTITATNDVKNQKVGDFIASVAKAPKGSLEEKVTFTSVHIDGNLASVWTPYKFYFNDNFSHCGVNSFQMHKENGTWKIQYIIDTRRKEGCEK